MEITLDIINKLDKNDKDYLARQLVIILLNGYYKDNIEIFTDYMLDAWHHEGWGNETMIRDISINEIVNRINSGDGFSDFEYVYYNHEEYYKNRKDDE